MGKFGKFVFDKFQYYAKIKLSLEKINTDQCHSNDDVFRLKRTHWPYKILDELSVSLRTTHARHPIRRKNQVLCPISGANVMRLCIYIDTNKQTTTP